MQKEIGVNVVVIGQVCEDVNSFLDGSRIVGPGSPLMFMQAVSNQFPGCSTRLIASYGSDFRKYLQSAEAKIYPPVPNSERTLRYRNIYPLEGDRVQKAINRRYARNVPVDGRVRSFVGDADVVIVSPILPKPSSRYCERILKDVRDTSVLKVLAPQGYMRQFDKGNRVYPRDFKEAERMLPNFDIVVVSEKDHEGMDNLANQWVDINPGLIVVITRAENGAAVITSEKRVGRKRFYKEYTTNPVPNEEGVDASGCGDIFTLAFALRYRETRDIDQSVRYANDIAGQRLRYPANKIVIDHAGAVLRSSLYTE